MSAHKTPVRASANAKGDQPAATASDTWSTLTVGTDGQVQGADSTKKTGLGWYNRSRAVARATADVVATLAAETTLATLALPTDLAAGDVLRFKAVIEQLNSSGGAVTFQYKLKLGATTIFDSGAQSASSTGGARGVLIDADILVVAPTNDERSSWTLTVGSGTFNSAQGVGTNIAARGTSATEDLTAGKNLVLTVTIGTAGAGISSTFHEAFLTAVRA